MNRSADESMTDELKNFVVNIEFAKCNVSIAKILYIIFLN